MKENISASGIIHLGMSDHSLVYAVRKFFNSKHKPAVTEVRDYKRFNTECFLWNVALALLLVDIVILMNAGELGNHSLMIY